MKIGYVVVRYGPEIVGGAEQACRMLGERMALEPGCSVEVFTTTASDAVTWADHYPPGSTTISNVVVHRFNSERGRDPHFDAFSGKVLADPTHATPQEAQRWVDLQGPVCPAAVNAAMASDADVVITTPYLFWPTVRGVTRLAADGRCVVMHPAAHDEAPIRLPLFADVFESARGLVWYTDGERRMAQTLFPGVAASPQMVLGLGVEPSQGDPSMFRSLAGLDDRPYLLCLGRVDDGKGALVLARFFAAYKRRRPGPLTLVFAGPVVNQPPDHPDIRVVGPLDEHAKWAALRGAEILVSPSPNESFSLVVLEAWAAGVPVIVNARCPATVEHTRRSEGGLAFGGYASFEAIVDLLHADVGLRRHLAANGSRYVQENFRWPVLTARYRRFLERLAEAHRRGRQATIH